MVLAKGIQIYTDGGSRGNPGLGAIGIVIVDKNGEMLHEFKECIGKCTNNQAEYMALIKALELATNYSIEEIVCFSDSQLLVRQMNGTYKVQDKKLIELFQKVKERERSFEKVTYEYVRREYPLIQRPINL